LLKKLFGGCLLAVAALSPTFVLAAHDEVALSLAKVQECNQPNVICLSAGRAVIKELPNAPKRILLSSPEIADFKLLPGNQLYLLGNNIGISDLIIWDARDQKVFYKLQTLVDLSPLNSTLKNLFPQEPGVIASTSPASIVLTGEVSNTVVAHSIESIAAAFVRDISSKKQKGSSAGAARSTNEKASTGLLSGVSPALDQTKSEPGGFELINLMRIRDPQQVMLDVRIAEVSKTISDQLGVNFRGPGAPGDVGWSIVSSFAGGVDGTLNLLLNSKSSNPIEINVDAEKDDGLIKILAQPTIVAMSGQEGNFLVGGKIFIPVNTVSDGAASTKLQKEDFGVGLKFIPTVLDKGRLNLKVYTEVSEVSRDPLVFESNSTRTVIPAINTRNVSTTVQLKEGESLVIGGLLRNNLVESIRAFPILGELPILGALFRSTKFNSEETELLIVVSPRLVHATNDQIDLPTDGFVPPSRSELFLGGKLEGTKEPSEVESK
jgi:pilus assembly protein CpaC